MRHWIIAMTIMAGGAYQAEACSWNGNFPREFNRMLIAVFDYEDVLIPDALSLKVVPTQKKIVNYRGPRGAGCPNELDFKADISFLHKRFNGSGFDYCEVHAKVSLNSVWEGKALNPVIDDFQRYCFQHTP